MDGWRARPRSGGAAEAEPRFRAPHDRYEIAQSIEHFTGACKRFSAIPIVRAGAVHLAASAPHETSHSAPDAPFALAIRRPGALTDVVHRTRRDGTTVILAEVQAQPLAALTGTRALREIGQANVVGSLELAIDRATLLLARGDNSYHG